MNEPAKILVEFEDLTNQYFLPFEDHNKKEVLIDLYVNLNISKALIFCNTMKSVTELADKMKEHDFPVSIMHDEMDQITRDLNMTEFLAGSIRGLITTDIFTRGIDTQGVSHVINYQLPLNKEDYIYRISRTGRYGRKGTVINFVKPQDARFIKEIQDHYKIEMKEMPEDLEEL